MLTKKGIAILFLVSCFFIPISHTVCMAQRISVEGLARTVIFLRHQTQAYEMKSGELFELWYKKKGQIEVFEPKLNTRLGTGFLIRHKAGHYLVTAKHVAEFLQEDGELILNASAGKTITIKFGDMRKSEKIQGVRWFFHPSADIAIHPIFYPRKVEVDQDYYPSDEIVKADEAISLLSTVYVVGFPLGQGVHDRLSPIAKKAQVASPIIPLEAQNISKDLRFILLDQALAQGYSGAPVFYIEDIMASNVRPPIKIGERLRLVGILSLQVPDQLGGKISGVVPISYLWQILQSADFIKYEKNIPFSP